MQALRWQSMTDEDKNAAVAEIVGLWKRESMGWWSHPDSAGLFAETPDYLHDANAVIALLEKVGLWGSVNFGSRTNYTVALWKEVKPERGHSQTWQQYATGEAKTFCEAACIALLRASGVDVVMGSAPAPEPVSSVGSVPDAEWVAMSPQEQAAHITSELANLDARVKRDSLGRVQKELL